MLRIPDGTVHLNAWAHCRLEAFSNAFRSATEDDYAHDVRGLCARAGLAGVCDETGFTTSRRGVCGGSAPAGLCSPICAGVCRAFELRFVILPGQCHASSGPSAGRSFIR